MITIKPESIQAFGSETRTKCTRCDTPIKYVYTHNDKPYGSTCIERVSGINPKDYVWLDTQPSEKLTKAKMEKRAIEIKETQEMLKQQKLEWAEIKEANILKFESLIVHLHTVSKYVGDFCDNMKNDILEANSSNQLSEILNPGAYRIVREIWAKQYGRKNSKAYKNGLIEFDELFSK